MKNVLIPSNLSFFRFSKKYFTKKKINIFYFGSGKDSVNNKNFLNFSKLLEKAISEHNDFSIKKKNYFKKDKNLNYIQDVFNLVSKRIFFGKNYDIELFFQFLVSELLKYLETNNIKFVIFHSTPHLPSSVALYYCCKILKIKTLILGKTAFDYIFILKKDWYSKFLYKFNKPINNLKNLYNFSKESKSIKIIKDKNRKDFIKPNLFNIFLYLTKRVIKIIFLKDKYDRDSYFHYVKTNYKFDEIKLVIFFVIKRLVNKFFYNNYFSSKKFDFKKKYIYFSLGYEPEGTNCPTGGIFHDQLKAIMFLRKTIDKKIHIYVKEHPSQFHIKDMPLDGFYYKNLDFYNKLKKLENIELLSTDINSQTLIKNALATCTISSTAGWESLMVGKKSIVFSNSWYSTHNNCLVVSDTKIKTQNDIKFFLNKNISKKKLQKENIKFINNLGKKFLYGDLWPKLHSPKNLKKMNKNFFDKLVEII